MLVVEAVPAYCWDPVICHRQVTLFCVQQLQAKWPLQ